VWLGNARRGEAGISFVNWGAEVFEVKGDEAQWKVIFARLSTMDIDQVVKDGELTSLLPDAPEGSVRGATYRAIKQIELDLSRSFTRVRNVGYRMVHAREHENLARDQHMKARRRVKAGQRKAHAADRALLTREERQRIDALELNMAQQADMLKRLDRGLKTERLERKAETAELAEQMAAMQEQLRQLHERHGKSVPSS
jgi:hypothetical protein